MAIVLCQATRADDKLPEFDLWPLFYYDRDRDTGARQLEFLWPIGGWEDDAKQSSLFFRPFWNRRTEKEAGATHSVFLYPMVGSSSSRKDYSETRFIYLYKQGSAQITGGRTQNEFNLLPFFIWGTRDGKLKAAVIFPLFGSLTDWLGRDRWIFVLWPLFSYESRGGAQKYNVLFPVFAYRTSPKGQGYKVWPLFGYRNDERGRGMFFLWPLFTYDRAVLRQGGERVSYLSWPLWYQEDSPGGYQRAVAWPLFKYTYEKRDERRRLEAPAPIFVWERSKEGRVVRILPLLIYRTAPNCTEMSVLWPIFWWRKETTGGRQATSFRIMPIFWTAREQQEGRESNLLQLWPLTKRVQHEDGSTFTEIPTLTWSSYDEAFERNFAPFFRLIEYRSRASGGRDFRVLWRLIRWETEPDSWFAELTPLFACYDKSASATRGQPGGEARFRFTLLKGLFDYRTVGDQTKVKLLYVIPIWSSGPSEGKKPEVNP